MIKKLLLFITFILSYINAFAQRDTEHWIAPYNSSSVVYTNVLYLSTDSTDPFDVEIFNNNIQIGTVTISKGNPQTFSVPQDMLLGIDNLDAFKVTTKGVYLKAGKPFYCTLKASHSVHAEIVTSKGKAGIGKKFYVAASPNKFSNANNIKTDNFTAGILATEDNTTVTVSWTTSGLVFLGGTPTGNSHTVTLNKGQSFIFAGETFDSLANRTGFIGAKVVSDKPITLTNGSANGNFADTDPQQGSDLILDQSVPTERLGNTFAMIKTKSTNPVLNMEGGIVIATEDNTQIFINDSTTPVATINEGEWFRINENNYVEQTPGSGHFNMFVSTSKNVYLYQFIGIRNSAFTGGFSYIPPLNCFLPRKIDEIAKINEMPGILDPIRLKLNILTEAGATVTVNGITPSPSQGPFPLTGNTQWETYAIKGITGNVTITSTKAVTAGVSGGYSAAGYGGYFAGFSSVPAISKTGDCLPGIILEVDDNYDTYQWFLNGNPINGATANTFTPDVAGNYTVKVTAGTCKPVITPVFKVFSCVHKSTKNIMMCSGNTIINPAFTVSTQTYIPATVSVATPPNNGTVNIDANGIITYTPNAGFFGNDNFAYKFCGNASEFIDCEEVTVNMTVEPQLNVQNSSLTQCSNTFDLTTAESNITTVQGATFDYYENQSDAVAGNSNIIANPTAYTSGNNTVFVRVKSGSCFGVAELQLNFVPLVAPVITSTSPTICAGASVILSSHQATGNIWSTGETTQSVTINTPGIYTLTINNGACSSSSSITINQSVDPNVQITGNLTICNGFDTTLTATANGTGNTFIWSNGTSGPVNTISTPGIYSVTVTTPEGCQYKQSVTVKSDTQIIANITTPAEITCATPKITLDATSSVFGGGATFLWTAAGGGNIIAGADTLTPTVNNAGTYTLSITSEARCTHQSTVNVIENKTSPVIGITASQLVICNGESIVLTATGAATYNWETLPGTGDTQTVSPTVTTIYTVEGIGANGCKAQQTITIEVIPEITSTLQNVEICEGDRTILDAGAGPHYTYLWNTGETTQTIIAEHAGVYTVAINNGACTRTFSATISHVSAPEISEILYNNDHLIIKVKNGGITGVEYSIDNGVTWQSSNVFVNVLRNTEYIIRVRNKGATCDAVTEYYTLFMVNTITPNGDGRNDTINFHKIVGFEDFKGEIYDRYGRIIFRINAANPVWNGKESGRALPTATYWYKLSWKNYFSKKPVHSTGWILLKNRN